MLSLATLLFLIMDPFGNLVVVNALLAEFSRGEKTKVLLREGAIAAGLLILAAIFGHRLLDALALEEHSIRLAGGIVLFIIALGMLFPSHNVLDEPAADSPLIVPIAMPLIAGPGALSMVILFAERTSVSIVCLAIVIATIATTLLLLLGSRIFGLLGRRGAIALERLMGMLLTMLSVQMVLDGVSSFLDSRAL